MPDLTPEYSSRDRHSNYVSSGVSNFLGVKGSGSGSRYSKGGCSSSSVGVAPSSVGQSAPSSFGSFFQPDGNLPGMGGHSSIAGMAASLVPSGVNIQTVEVGISNRGQNTKVSASLDLCSRTDRLRIGTSYTTGVSGRSVDLESAYSGSGDNTSVLGSIHALTTASIMQLTDRRTDRLSVAPLVLGGLVVGRVAIPHVVRWSRTIVNAYLLAEQVREQAEEAAKKVADESTSAATGGPKGQLPDGEDPEKKETGKHSKKTEDLLGKTDRMKEQLFERAGKDKSETTLSAARTELNGEQIAKAAERGRTYDHVQKVESAKEGLGRHIRAINDRLSWTDLPAAERPALQQELSEASKLLDLAKTYVP